MVMSCAFAAVGVERLELLIEPANRAFVRTAEGCGFRHEGLLRKRRKIGAERVISACCDIERKRGPERRQVSPFSSHSNL